MYNVLLVANHIINYCNDHDSIISNLKLQKILYFVQGIFLSEKNIPCFEDEIEAWDFGPVVPKVYYQYRIYGNSYIPYIITKKKEKINYKDELIINKIIDKYAKYSASELVEITHQQDPWINSYEHNRRKIISKQQILDYFKHNK